jgi:hypothetical protein
MPAIVGPECEQIGQDQDTRCRSERGLQYQRPVQVTADACPAPFGEMLQCPASGPNSRPKTNGESKRGKLNHSTDPERSTKALEWRSDKSA